jgi:hypothetical protein
LQGFFTTFGCKQRACCFYKISSIKIINKKIKLIFSQLILFEEHLYFRGAIFDMKKRELAHGAQTANTTPLHAPAAHHPQRIVTEADEKGRVKDLKIFAGLPIEVSIDDENALLCTADGKVRSVLLHLSGEQLARILGRQSVKDIPEPELQNGQPAMLFLGADGKWVLAINGNVAYVVGRASADARGSMGTVYSDREDIKAALGTERFREAERTSDYLADPDLHDVLQSMPMLQCSDGNRPGLLGDTRAQNLRNMNMVVEHIRGQLRQPQHSGK